MPDEPGILTFRLNLSGINRRPLRREIDLLFRCCSDRTRADIEGFYELLGSLRIICRLERGLILSQPVLQLAFSILGCGSGCVSGGLFEATDRFAHGTDRESEFVEAALLMKLAFEVGLSLFLYRINHTRDVLDHGIGHAAFVLTALGLEKARGATERNDKEHDCNDSFFRTHGQNLRCIFGAVISQSRPGDNSSLCYRACSKSRAWGEAPSNLSRNCLPHLAMALSLC